MSYTAGVQTMIGSVRRLLGDEDYPEDAFSLRYISASSNNVALTISSEVLGIAIDGVSSISLTLSNYSSTRALSNYLDGLAAYETEFLGSNGAQDPRDLMDVTSQDIVSSPYVLQTGHRLSDAAIYSYLYDICMSDFNNTYTPETLERNDTAQIELKAAILGCNALIGRAASFVPGSVGGLNIDVSAFINQYNVLRESLEKTLRDTVRERIVGAEFTIDHPGVGTVTPASKIRQIIPVNLYPITDYTATTVDLNWSMNANDDFYAYEVYYRLSGGSWTLARTINDSQDTDYTITGLSSGSTYEFKIRLKTALSYWEAFAFPSTQASSAYKEVDSNVQSIAL